MIVHLFLALQATAPADIEIRASVRARALTIEKAGEAKVSVTADGRNLVSIEAPKASGRKQVANPVIKVDIEARIADPRGDPQPQSPPSE